MDRQGRIYDVDTTAGSHWDYADKVLGVELREAERGRTLR